MGSGTAPEFIVRGRTAERAPVDAPTEYGASAAASALRWRISAEGVSVSPNALRPFVAATGKARVVPSLRVKVPDPSSDQRSTEPSARVRECAAAAAWAADRDAWASGSAAWAATAGTAIVDNKAASAVKRARLKRWDMQRPS